MKKITGLLLGGIALVSLASCGTKKCKISFNTYTDEKISSVTVKKGGSYDVSSVVPTREGQKFMGWYLDQAKKTPFTSDTKVTSSITLYAKWVKLVTYTFESNGGSNIETMTAGQNEAVELKTPTKETKSVTSYISHEYSFVGWYTDKELTKYFNAENGSEENVTLYAKWSEERNIKNETKDVTSTILSSASEKELFNMSSNSGFTKDAMLDFSQYEGTSAYKKVTTPEQFLSALKSAKASYETKWDSDAGCYTQTGSYGSVHVIEIANDLEMGYYKLSSTAKGYGNTEDYCRKQKSIVEAETYTLSSMFKEYGMTNVKIEGITDLLIYSKNGSKITHAGFSLLSCQDVAIRNLEFDEMWQWEDSAKTDTPAVGDYDAFGWAYMKISFSTGIWVDHCKFGKSYDGQIDVSNGCYWDGGERAFRAPYMGDKKSGVNISNCTFGESTSNYLSKMMQEIEANYQSNKADSSKQCKYLYYKALRDAGFTYDQIYYGIAVPQKKGFLLGDDNDPNNYHLKISFNSCLFKNIETRLFKVRGAIVTSLNCIYDSTEYQTYRKMFYNGSSNLGKKAVEAVSSKWKCAMVSEGILISDGGSLYTEASQYSGIASVIKFNDGDDTVGGIMAKDVIVTTVSGTVLEGDYNAIKSVNLSSEISPNNFSWNNEENKCPFEMKAYSKDELTSFLSNTAYGAGTRNLGTILLYTNYKK